MYKIFDEVMVERENQISKWGTEADDTINTPWMWTAYLSQYASRWMKGDFTLDTDAVSSFRAAMVKVATIAFSAIESIDRQRETAGKTFYEEGF